jgi:TPR repeat protein
MLFYEAMEHFFLGTSPQRFKRFEKPAQAGCEKSRFVLDTIKEVPLNDNQALREAFAATNDGLGYYLAAKISEGKEAFSFYQKSSELGCSWGHAGYALYFQYESGFTGKNMELYLELLRKSAIEMTNPLANCLLGNWYNLGKYNGGNEPEKAFQYLLKSAQLGWLRAMNAVAEMYRMGKGCEKSLEKACFWSAKVREEKKKEKRKSLIHLLFFKKGKIHDFLGFRQKLLR